MKRIHQLMLTINDVQFDQETERLKNMREEINPIDDKVNSELFDLIDNMDSSILTLSSIGCSKYYFC